MGSIRTLQSSFVTGEIDETVFGRVDTEIYSKGASALRNVYVRPQGGAFRREGLEFIREIDGTNFRVVPFEFNNEQTYILVFSDANGGEMTVITANDGVFQVTVADPEFSVLAAAPLAELNFTQSADTLILAHNSFQPLRVLRNSDVSWTIEKITLENVAPFAYGTTSLSNPAGTMKADQTTGIVTITSNNPIFTAAYEGQFINTDKGGRIYVKTFVSTTELEGCVVLELEEDATDTNGKADGDWELEEGFEPVMSDTRGWAGAVTFFKSRLWFGNVGERPQTILASKVGEFFNFDIGSGLDDEGLDITIDDDRVNRITDFFPGRGLQIFTTGGEFVIQSDLQDPVTPATVANQLQKQTLHGSGNDDTSIIRKQPRPTSVDGTTVFVELGGSVVRQFVFNETEQSFNAANISILSPHLIRDPVSMDIRRATDLEPSDYLYLVNSDGTCAVLNSLREQDLLAWTLFETEGEFQEVAVSGREAYFLVKRNVDGVDTFFLERLNPDHFMDSSVLQTSGAPTDSWSGLDHLDNELVKVRGDDYILDQETITGGSITSSIEAVKLEAGIGFNAKITTLPMEVAIQGESMLGQFKSLRWVNLRLFSSRNVIVEYGSKVYKIPFRTFGEEVLDDPISNVSVWKKVYLGGYDREVQVTVTQEDPLEFNLLGIVLGVRV